MPPTEAGRKQLHMLRSRLISMLAIALRGWKKKFGTKFVDGVQVHISGYQ